MFIVLKPPIWRANSRPLVVNSLGQRRVWMCFGIDPRRTSSIWNKGLTKFPIVTVSLCNLSYDAQVKGAMPWLSQPASVITLKTHVTQDNVEGDSPQDQGHQCPDDDFNKFRIRIHFKYSLIYIESSFGSLCFYSNSGASTLWSKFNKTSLISISLIWPPSPS